MNTARSCNQLDPDPSDLLDALLEKLDLKNDAALSRVLNLGPPTISKIRHRKQPVNADILVRMHDASGLSIQELRALMGDHRANFSTSNQYQRQEKCRQT